MPSTPYLVCVWRHAEHTVYGVLGTLYFLQCKPQNQAGWHKINIYNIVLHVKILKHGMYNNEL